MVWVMVDIGPIMVVMVMVDIGPITVDIGPIMVGMVVGMVVGLVVVIPQLRTFNDRTAHKQLRIHRPTIGTTAAIRKAIIHMSKIVQTAGCRLPLSQLRQL